VGGLGRGAGSFLIGCLTLIIILLVSERLIIIHDQNIVFCTTRAFGLVKSCVNINFNQITKVVFHPGVVNWLVVFLPGIGGRKNAKLVFELNNGD